MEPWVRKFTKCPYCGSEERYFEGIIKVLKERKLIAENVACFDFQRQQGVALSPEKINTMPIGTELPAFDRIEDTCCDCGAVYAVLLAKPEVRKSLTPVTIMPNRAQRRHGGIILPGPN